MASPASLAGDTPEEVAEQLQSSADHNAMDPNQPAGNAAVTPPAALPGDSTEPADLTEPGSSLDELTREQDRLDIQSYRNVIADIERNEGAYSPNVSEHLMSLGSALQQSGEHAEAIAIFKRGVHLSRINDGLYGAEQIPLLQSEIRSHLALGDFAAADERQVYLYRVQLRSLSSGPRRANALMQQAGWQQQAYELRLGEHGFNRLMNMWDLYRLALNDIIKREGEHSASLLSPLYGMLRAQYLISDYQGEGSSGFSSEYDFAERQGQSRFNAYRAQSYKKGLSVIRAIQDIETTVQPGNAAVAANAYLRLADWMMWHGQDEEALANYRQAFAELAASSDAQLLQQQLFGAPVALPALEGVEGLPPTVAQEQGNALLSFSVTENGRLIDLERLDDYEDNDAKVNRLMRQLRKTQFRPRFEAGEPVATEHIVWAYDSNNW
ncbi:energy transducer TonB [Parahaliea mediterranea]|uniref:energy transducer TonB n=1 Tax=Parahaliea mediterranea TaxID=651086 RepID=UPI000E2F1ABC|nr:hypothetical protein [Parahaliea mediterranea]